MVLLAVCFAVFLTWSCFIVMYLHRIIFKTLRFLEKVDDNIVEKFKPIQRKDRHLWNITEIYICGILLLPLRLASILGAILTLISVLSVFANGNLEESQVKELPRWRRVICKTVTRCVAKIILIASGIYLVEKRFAKIKDYDDTYEQPEKIAKTATPIIVSNHISIFDGVYFSQSEDQPSFLAKSEVAKIPLIGTITKGIQSIFVSRDSRDNKNAVMDDLRRRGQLIASGKQLPPIVIFPEGTSTNGDYLISFKKGAFEPMLPIKIVCLEYQPRHISLSLDSIPVSISLLLILCQLKNNLRVIEFETYYPDHLGLSIDNPNGWEVYARKVKDIMLKAMKHVKDSNSGYRDIRDYDTFTQKIAMKTGEHFYRNPENANPNNVATKDGSFTGNNNDKYD